MGVKLNPRQKRFVNEYVIDLNQAQAAIRAGYAADRANVTGSELVANRKIAMAIAERQSAIMERTEWTQDRVISELATSVQLARDEGQHGPAVKAIELIGRHIGMWPREAPQVNIDARTLSLGSDVIEAIGGMDGLRRLAMPPGDDCQ